MPSPTRRRKRIMIATVLILAVALGGAWLIRSSQTAVAPVAGKLAPDFTLPIAGGGEVMLSDLRGDPVVLNFWATWCPPCRREMPHLNRLYAQYRSQGLRLYGINLQESEEAVLEFSDSYSLDFPLLLDETGEVSNRYLVRAIPVTVFIDGNGRIEQVHTGEMTPEIIEKLFSSLLEGEGPV